MSRLLRKAPLLAAVFCGLLWLVPVARAAEETHLFDPTLSLTGDCSTSPADEVPDPGLCPMPPGQPGVDHPAKPFEGEAHVAVDRYGDLYVAVHGAAADGSEGRIDVFGPDGGFITEVRIPNPQALAVDGEGNLYVARHYSGEGLFLERLEPSTYVPSAKEIAYNTPPHKLEIEPPNYFAINPLNNRLLVPPGGAGLSEYGSAAEGNQLLQANIVPAGTLFEGKAIAIDAAHDRMFVASTKASNTSSDPERGRPEVKVFELDGSHELLATIDGSTTPAGKFLSDVGFFPLAVDEATGHLFFGEIGLVARRKVYELEWDGGYVGSFEHSFAGNANNPSLALDNGPASPARGTFYLTSGQNPPVHVFAFAPKPPPQPPTASLSVTGITEDEAVLRADVNPEGSETSYAIEYTTEQRYEEEGESFNGATVAREGTLAGGKEAVALSAPLEGLPPGSAYRARLRAHSAQGDAEAQLRFATYRSPEPSGGCANEALRTGASAALPDCRAYELVTPPNTNGHTPFGLPRYEGAGTLFPSRATSPSGDALSFLVEGGGIPGMEGTGGLKGDAYLASRGPGGWQTALAGPDGSEADSVAPGAFAGEQGYSFFAATGGSLAPGAAGDTYLRYPDGHFAPIGRGNLGTDPKAVGLLISPDGGHVIFASTMELEAAAAPAGTQAIYDRVRNPESGEEETRVVSLLPGNVPASAGQRAGYVGASRDGRGIAFEIGKRLYLRYGGETYEVGAGLEEGLSFAGIAEGGSRLFYLQGGDLWRFEAPGQARTRFTEAGDVTPVNVSADGSAAYFISATALPVAPGPGGATPVAGQPNLYLSREGAISFLATVSEEDLKATAEAGKFGEVGEPEGLGTWLRAVEASLTRSSEVDLAASRTSADGSVLAFSSHADLSGYESHGKAEIYRYDQAADTLACLSCNPTLQAPKHDAKLQTRSRGWGADSFPLSREVDLQNLTADGNRVFFESTEALVPADVDGLRDVYEWEEDGTGSCRSAGGCVYLISSGQSAQPDYLYAVSDGGRDVFIESGDLLLPAQDSDETPSIYDAREGGGFAPPPPAPGECLGEACQAAATPPLAPALASSVFQGAGNVTAEAPHRCPKGKRAVRRKGVWRCLPKPHHRKPHRKKPRHAKGRAGR